MKEVDRVLGALGEFKDNTNKRLDKFDERFNMVDAKLDALQGFRWRLVGAGMLASLVISVAVTILAAKI